MSIFEELLEKKQNRFLGPETDVFLVGNAYVANPSINDWVNGSARKAFANTSEAAKAHDNERALHLYLEAIQLEPTWSLAYLSRGTLLDKMGRTNEARRHYEKMIELKPVWPQAFYNLAVHAKNKGDFAEAYKLLEVTYKWLLVIRMAGCNLLLFLTRWVIQKMRPRR